MPDRQRPGRPLRAARDRLAAASRSPPPARTCSACCAPFRGRAKAGDPDRSRQAAGGAGRRTDLLGPARDRAPDRDLRGGPRAVGAAASGPARPPALLSFVRRAALLLLLAGICEQASFAHDARYRGQIEAWRAQREKSLKADDGWLAVSRALLAEGGATTAFGSGGGRRDVPSRFRCGRTLACFEHRQGRDLARARRARRDATRRRHKAVRRGRGLAPSRSRRGGARRGGDRIGLLCLRVIKRGDRTALQGDATPRAPRRRSFAGLDLVSDDREPTDRGALHAFGTPRSAGSRSRTSCAAVTTRCASGGPCAFPSRRPGAGGSSRWYETD